MGSPVNGKWTILKTTDGGNTWNHLATEPAQTGGESGLLSFQLLGNTLWFGSSSGYVYRSTDLGGTWASIPTSGIYTLGLHFNSATVGMTGFLSGVTNRSTDGGATWDSASNTGTKEVSSISGIGNEFWAITGSNIAYTNDAGKNWGFTSPGHVGFISLNAVNFSPITSLVNGWAVGETGMILHYQRHNTSVPQDASTLPTQYRLEQNYPNPFNPNTIISYTLPFASNVKLTVYNTLGQSIKVLAEGFENAGKYSINFNASDLPSGIYFYRLEATGYSATKKLVIIK
jgi:photosystem II stability/assembly factor-like uncharacterized protein